jgi:hypothetical protein
MLLICIILATALAMEGIGSYISVVGLSDLFGADKVIMGMAVIMDVAKIASVSFLYQQWHDIKAAMRSYMVFAVVLLMLITNAGAFGYLSNSVQKALQPNKELYASLELSKKEKVQLEVEKLSIDKQRAALAKQIAELPPDVVRGRQRLIASFKPEQDRLANRSTYLDKRLIELTEAELKLSNQVISADVHVGPITYVAKTFNISLEDASKYIILLIIFVFDPLAITLVLAANFLILKRKPADITEQLATEQPTTAEEPIIEEPPIADDVPAIEFKQLKELKPLAEFNTPQPAEAIKEQPVQAEQPMPEPSVRADAIPEVKVSTDSLPEPQLIMPSQLEQVRVSTDALFSSRKQKSNAGDRYM